MSFIRGEGRLQSTLFPVMLEDLIPADHVCRVIDAFVGRLDMQTAGFVRAEPAETGRPGYDPRDLLKLYTYGYLHQIRSSRRLEAECRRNVEVMWLLERLYPDHKSIAEFRRVHREAVEKTGAELVRLARSVGLIRGEWVAIDGSKFGAVSSAESVREREAMARYLDELEKGDSEEEVIIDPQAVAAALEKLRQHPEPEADFMKTRQGKVPAYNVQTAVDAEHGLMVAQQVTTEKNDLRSLLPMAEAAQQAVGEPEQTMHVVADAGYSNATHAAECERAGIVVHVPAVQVANRQGDGTLFKRTQFQYQPDSDSYVCPNGNTLQRQRQDGRSVIYAARQQDCNACALKPRCTLAQRRIVKRHRYQAALERMQAGATAEAMRLRRSIVEHPFAFLKYRIFGYPRFLLRGVHGASTEIGLASIAYNLKRMMSLLGGKVLTATFVSS
jgi:transposase